MEFYWQKDQKLLKEIETIPNRLAFKIGEVAKLVGVKTYVLRYWETEFEVLKPQKSDHNQRVYSRKDVEIVFLIKKLLYKDCFSLKGARAALERYGVEGMGGKDFLISQKNKPSHKIQKGDILLEVRDSLKEILESVQKLKASCS